MATVFKKPYEHVRLFIHMGYEWQRTNTKEKDKKYTKHWTMYSFYSDNTVVAKKNNSFYFNGTFWKQTLANTGPKDEKRPSRYFVACSRARKPAVNNGPCRRLYTLSKSMRFESPVILFMKLKLLNYLKTFIFRNIGYTWLKTVKQQQQQIIIITIITCIPVLTIVSICNRENGVNLCHVLFYYVFCMEKLREIREHWK